MAETGKNNFFNDIDGKNLAIGSGLTLAGLYGLANIPTEVSNLITSGAAAVGQAAGYVSSSVSNIIGGTFSPVIGAFAPYAAPMLAGGFVGNKLAKAMKIENETLRKIVNFSGTLAGAFGGAALVGTAATPFLTVAGTGVGLYLGLKGLGWTGKKVGGLLKGGYKGMREAGKKTNS